MHADIADRRPAFHKQLFGIQVASNRVTMLKYRDRIFNITVLIHMYYAYEKIKEFTTGSHKIHVYRLQIRLRVALYVRPIDQRRTKVTELRSK
jgi:hypothetical protein